MKKVTAMGGVRAVVAVVVVVGGELDVELQWIPFGGGRGEERG